MQDLDIEVFRPAFRHFQYYHYISGLSHLSDSPLTDVKHSG